MKRQHRPLRPAELDAVAVGQADLVDPGAVDESPVLAAEVAEPVLPALHFHRGMELGDDHAADGQVVFRTAPDGAAGGANGRPAFLPRPVVVDEPGARPRLRAVVAAGGPPGGAGERGGQVFGRDGGGKDVGGSRVPGIEYEAVGRTVAYGDDGQQRVATGKVFYPAGGFRVPGALEA